MTTSNKINLKINNVNAAAFLCGNFTRLPLKDIIDFLPNSYLITELNYLSLELKSPKNVSNYPECKEVQLFDSGAILVRGATSEDNARRAVRLVGRKLQKNGFKIKIKKYRQTNVFSSFRVPYNLDLMNLLNIDRYKFHQNEKTQEFKVLYYPNPSTKIGLKYGEFKEVIEFFSSGFIKLHSENIENACKLASVALNFASQGRIDCESSPNFDQMNTKMESMKRPFDDLIEDDFTNYFMNKMLLVYYSSVKF